MSFDLGEGESVTRRRHRAGRIGPLRWVRCVPCEIPELGMVTFVRLGPIFALWWPLSISWLSRKERHP